MDNVTFSYLSMSIPLIVGLFGLIICVRGYLKTRRILFAYSAFFFAARIIPNIVFLSVNLLGLFYQADIMLTANYISTAFHYISLLALAGMIWAFYNEYKRSAAF